jgi:hypothetical protein
MTDSYEKTLQTIVFQTGDLKCYSICRVLKETYYPNKNSKTSYEVKQMSYICNISLIIKIYCDYYI